jgi:hypothetical protein
VDHGDRTSRSGSFFAERFEQPRGPRPAERIGDERRSRLDPEAAGGDGLAIVASANRTR